MGIKAVSLVFFSGTGGTRRAAEGIKTALEENGAKVFFTELNAIPVKYEEADVYVLVYPVYAMNAPLPIDEWIEKSPDGRGKPAAVISVSGGGEICPNTACRTECKKMLGSRGYEVVYERMLVMPSNWIVRGDDSIAVRLLRELPKRAKRIADDILSENKRFTKPKLIDRILSKITVLEKKKGNMFGRKINVGSNCTACSICERGCPRGNIHIADGRPVFGDRCVICLKCIYSCPQNALKPGTLKFVVIKEGFNLSEFEEKMLTAKDLPPIDEVAKGYIWSGVRKYLAEKD